MTSYYTVTNEGYFEKCWIINFGFSIISIPPTNVYVVEEL